MAGLVVLFTGETTLFTEYFMLLKGETTLFTEYFVLLKGKTTLFTEYFTLSVDYFMLLTDYFVFAKHFLTQKNRFSPPAAAKIRRQTRQKNAKKGRKNKSAALL